MNIFFDFVTIVFNIHMLYRQGSQFTKYIATR